ncbi:hypothetical protein DPX16_23451 [Anabarilius grahami]|uniref:Uncharacterized protein n=1 Tax=Anabarilius grahami TaxID=495550 RepID=A0A3N0YSE8_ANAGA|nr:hypothetical protein DPX16_23451 [Anabarilius grahami]
MDGLLRNCATGCRVDEAFTMDDLVDSISADTSGLRCGHVQLRIVFITPFLSIEDRIHHTSMEPKMASGLCRGPVWFLWSLRRTCADGCHGDEAFTGDCLVDTDSADIQGCVVVVSRTVTRQEAKWKRERGTGSGKDHEPGLERYTRQPFSITQCNCPAIGSSSVTF